LNIRSPRLEKSLRTAREVDKKTDVRSAAPLEWREAVSRLISLGAFLTALVALPLGAEAGSARLPPPSHWLSWSAGTRTARLVLIAGYDSANNGFNFDGYARGRMLVRVPRSWRLTIVCRNAGPRNHSCGVVRGTDTSHLAFRGAAIPDARQGLLPGQGASFTFVVSRLGVYRIVCLVPGHAQAREYIVLEVTRPGRPSARVV
jgi:Sulfocyanin (SoxE) domain